MPIITHYFRLLIHSLIPRRSQAFSCYKWTICTITASKDLFNHGFKEWLFLSVYVTISLILNGELVMIEKYCVFLRGVNVNGVKMKMDELKKAFAGMSFPDAKTVLAAGNVIISTDRRDSSVLKSEIEKHLSDVFKYDANVFLRTAEELKSVISVAGVISVPPDCHLYYLICDDKSIVFELGSVFAALPHKQGEAFIPNDSGAFWVVPVGETLESAFGSKALGDKKYKSKLTSRNMNTIEKIAGMMRD